MIELIHGDCMDYMSKLPDKAFELAIVDPPYGLGEDGASNNRRGKGSTIFLSKSWDSQSENEKYFTELFRISENQIIWGANHFINKMPLPSPCWIVWDKCREFQDFADCELAWTSFWSAVKKFTFAWDGFRQGDMKNKEKRIHPTQKPVKLYEWLLINYAQKGDRILDTHLGSGSSAIACHNLGFDMVGIELDKDYFEAASKRLKDHQLQGKLFDNSLL